MYWRNGSSPALARCGQVYSRSARRADDPVDVHLTRPCQQPGAGMACAHSADTCRT
jgi:hypothetical protein